MVATATPAADSSTRYTQHLPATLQGVLAGLVSAMTPFAIESALPAGHDVPMTSVTEFGLESGLASGGVDLAVRGAPARLRDIGWLDATAHAVLTTAERAAIDSTWVEIDLTNPDRPVAAFIPGDSTTACDLLLTSLRHADGPPGAQTAVERLREAIGPLGLSGVCGTYPHRTPPVAGAALRVTSDVRSHLEMMRVAGAVTLDPDGSELQWLDEHLDEHCLTVAAAPSGPIVCGVESRFAHDVVAARDGSWARILALPQPWAVDHTRVAALDALPGAWRYSGVLPTVLITGVSHLKVAPTAEGSRAKVYFGGRIEWGGAR